MNLIFCGIMLKFVQKVYLSHVIIIGGKGMTASALKKESDSYWNLIKDACSEVKLVLIKRLSDALRPAEAEKKAKQKKFTADDFAEFGTMNILWIRRISTRPFAVPAM